MGEAGHWTKEVVGEQKVEVDSFAEWSLPQHRWKSGGPTDETSEEK